MDQRRPGIGIAAHQGGRRHAGDVLDRVADEVDRPARPGPEHGARHLGDDAAELLLAPRDVGEQVANGHPHGFHLGAQAAQLAGHVEHQRGVEVAAREAVGKAGQGAQRRVQALAQESEDQQQRHGDLHRQHQRVVALLVAQFALAAQVVHLDGHVADALALHHDPALGAQHVATGALGRAHVDETVVGQAAHLDAHHGGIAHDRVDQRARGLGIHVPERLLHAQRQDLGVALQGFVEFGDRVLAFLHDQQEIAGHQRRHHQAADDDHQHGRIDRLDVEPAYSRRESAQINPWHGRGRNGWCRGAGRVGGAPLLGLSSHSRARPGSHALAHVLRRG